MPLPEAVFVSLVMLSGGHIIASDALADVASVEVSGRQVAIACRDGECFFVHMVAAERVDRSLGPLPLEGSVRFARISPDGTTFTYRD